MDNNTVFVVGGGMLQCYMIREAQALGLRVICSDGNPACPGATLADAFIHLDTYDVAGHATLGKMYKGNAEFLGVVTCGADVAPSVSALAQAAGVRGIPLGVAQLTHDKRAVRDALEDAGLNGYQPEWDEYCIHCQEDGMAQHYEGPYPCVVKPTEERASRGVTIVRNSAYLREAIEKASAYSSIYLIEEYLQGTEHSAEIIFGDEGEVLWFNVVDRFFDYSNGVPIELGHLSPTLLDEQKQQQILLMMMSSAKALGVRFSAWKNDIIVTENGPAILEVTARLSGGYDSQGTAPLTGRHPMRVLLQVSCGMSVEKQLSMENAEGYAACSTICATQCGKVAYLPTLEDIGVDPASAQVLWNLKKGDVLKKPKHNAERIGFLLIGNKALRGKNDARQLWETSQQIASDLGEKIDVS